MKTLRKKAYKFVVNHSFQNPEANKRVSPFQWRARHIKCDMNFERINLNNDWEICFDDHKVHNSIVKKPTWLSQERSNCEYHLKNVVQLIV